MICTYQWHIQSFFGQTSYILESPFVFSATMVTCYLNEWKHFCRQSLLSIWCLLFIFCLLSHFDFFNMFLCWIATERRKLKNLFWLPEFGHPNWYTRLPNGLDTTLHTNTLYVPLEHQFCLTSASSNLQL